MSLKNKCSIY